MNIKCLKYIKRLFRKRKSGVNRIKVIIFIVAFSLNMAQKVPAAFERNFVGGREAGLAGAYTAVSDDAEAVWYNPAGLRLCRGIQFNTTYTDLYGLGELSYFNFSFVVPTLYAGTWALGYSAFGPSCYRETDLRLSFSAALTRGIYFGTSFKNNSVKIGNDGGKASAFGVDIGVTGNVSDKFRMAVCGININNPGLGDTSERPAQRFSVGFQVKPCEGLSSSLDLQKPADKDLEVRIGNELSINKNFVLRIGVQTFPVRFACGFGVNWSIFTLNYAFLKHRVLDAQHLFSLMMKFGEEDKRRRKSIYKSSEFEREFRGTVNINTAGVDEISRLPGVGKVTAKKIVEYREKMGRFKSIKEIMNIYGFSRSKYNKFKKYMTVEDVKEEQKKEPEMEEYPVKEYEEYEEYPEPESEVEPRTEPGEETVIEFEQEPAVEPVEESTDEAGQETEPEIKPESEVEPRIEKININKANIKELQGIPGISYPLARNIVRHRKTRGYFRNWEDLLKVPGMNQKILESIKKSGTLQ